MTGLVRKATLLSVCGLLIASAAVAGVPTGATSTAPGSLILGPYGSVTGPGARIESGSVPDVLFEYSVIVRDLASNTVANAPVTIDFSACHELRIGADQPQPGTTVDCLNHTVSVTTGPTGVATFRIAGGSEVQSPIPPGTTAPTVGCAAVRSGIVILRGNVRISTPDLDNSSSGGGVSAADLAAEIDIIKACLAPFPGPYYIERGDMDHDGKVDAVDLNVQIDQIAYMLNPAHAANNGKTCADVPHSCCSLLP